MGCSAHSSHFFHLGGEAAELGSGFQETLDDGDAVGFAQAEAVVGEGFLEHGLDPFVRARRPDHENSGVEPNGGQAGSLRDERTGWKPAVHGLLHFDLGGHDDGRVGSAGARGEFDFGGFPAFVAQCAEHGNFIADFAGDADGGGIETGAE